MTSAQCARVPGYHGYTTRLLPYQAAIIRGYCFSLVSTTVERSKRFVLETEEIESRDGIAAAVELEVYTSRHVK